MLLCGGCVEGALQQHLGCVGATRQLPEVYGLCHTILHVARVKEHTAMRESHALLFDSRNVCSLTRAKCKNVRQNLIPRATA